MKLACTISQRPDGQWVIRHSGRDVGEVVLSAASCDEAVEKMRAELRYRLEFCACVGDRYEDLQVELIGASGG